MKKIRTLIILALTLFGGAALTGCDEPFVDQRDCVGTWYITFDYDNWGGYADGGIMVLYYNGRYDYYYSERDYFIDRIGYFGRWWTDGPNLLYTYGNDTFSYRITSHTYDMMRLHNNLPPGDIEVWYRYD